MSCTIYHENIKKNGTFNKYLYPFFKAMPAHASNMSTLSPVFF